MQMVKIQIPDRDAGTRAMMELSRLGRIDCYADGVYMVPEAALDVLRGLGVAYHELGRGGLDYAEKALRDSLAVHAQRRGSRHFVMPPA